jgi:hypothetical protein
MEGVSVTRSVTCCRALAVASLTPQNTQALVGSFCLVFAGLLGRTGITRLCHILSHM